MSSRLVLCRAGMRGSGRSGRVLIGFCRASRCGDCQCSRDSLPARGSSGSRLCRRLPAGGPGFLDLQSGGWPVQQFWSTIQPSLLSWTSTALILVRRLHDDFSLCLCFLSLSSSGSCYLHSFITYCHSSVVGR